MKNLVKAALCLTMTAGCTDLKFEDQKRHGNQEIRLDSLGLEELITARVEPTSKPQKYAVYLSWPRIQQNKRVRIRLSEVLAVVGPEQTSFSHEVDHNQSLTYVLDILSPANRVEKSYKKLVKVPFDLVIGDSFKSLNEDVKVMAKRTFLQNQSKFMTNGFRFELQTEELISDNAEILTFEDGKKAALSNNGRSPQEIVIKAQSATGKLKITLRGENGGDGANGAPFNSPAASGPLPGRGMQGPQCRRSSNLNGLGLCACIRRGSAGGNGQDGLQGNPGGNAGMGGSTGRLTVSIDDGREFDLQVSKFPGLPGAPGKGGPGQPGGAGGKAKAFTVCPGPNGEKGADGSPGVDGLLAEKGNEAPACIYIASEEKNDCF